MAKKWKRMSQGDVSKFLREKGVKRSGPHSMTKRVHHWACCSYCGLIALKNKATKQALKQVCTTYE